MKDEENICPCEITIFYNRASGLRDIIDLKIDDKPAIQNKTFLAYKIGPTEVFVRLESVAAFSVKRLEAE